MENPNHFWVEINNLTLRSEIDTNSYPRDVKITDTEINALNLHRHDFQGEWNYTIKPQIKAER